MRDAGKVVQEVLEHMSTLPGVKVRVTLDLQVESREGFAEDVVRTVSENCGALKFHSHGFEES
jgi:hypothetical protein